MNVSCPKAKQMIEDFKEGQFGHYVDLEMLLEHLEEQEERMSGEEAVLRFLYELSKTA